MFADTRRPFFLRSRGRVEEGQARIELELSRGKVCEVGVLGRKTLWEEKDDGGDIFLFFGGVGTCIH